LQRRTAAATITEATLAKLNTENALKEIQLPMLVTYCVRMPAGISIEKVSYGGPSE